MTVSHNDIIIKTPALIAVYDDFLSAPRVESVQPQEVGGFIATLTQNTYDFAKQQGGELPFSVLREICENFIHANFLEVAISIYDHGNTITFSDQGPGIEKKDLVLEPGVTSATAAMKAYIKGVGSGFPVAKEYIQARGGRLVISDNAKQGCVILISLIHNQTNFVTPRPAVVNLDNLDNQVEPQQGFGQSFGQSAKQDVHSGAGQTWSQQPHSLSISRNPAQNLSPQNPQSPRQASKPPQKLLTERELEALKLIKSEGIIGPASLSALLNTSTATAFRLLKKLESKGFVEVSPNKKRLISNLGLSFLQNIR